jgi:hypothetical protein
LLDAQGLTAGCTGVGFVVEIVVVGMIQRIRQVVLQFIAFYLIREILGFPRGGTGWAIGSRHGVLLGKIQSRASRARVDRASRVPTCQPLPPR